MDMNGIIKATEKFKELYGVDHPMQSPELVKTRVRNFRSDSDLKLEDDICKCIRSHSNGDDQVYKDIIQNTLLNLNIPCVSNKQVGDYLYDLYVPTHNLLIQICTSITHNDIVSFDELGSGISSMQHKQEAESAHIEGYECVHLFDWDNIFVLCELLKSNKPEFTEYTVELVDKLSYDMFCTQYYIGSPNKASVLHYGLYGDNNLIAVMSFRKSTSRIYDWEIVRYCECSYGYNYLHVKQLVDKFIVDNHPNNIVMYVDQSKYSGKELLLSGFSFVGNLYPQRVWSKGTQRILHTNISNRKYDDIFHTNYHSEHSLYTQMIEHGWLPVYDCGKKVYVYSIEV